MKGTTMDRIAKSLAIIALAKVASDLTDNLASGVLNPEYNRAISEMLTDSIYSILAIDN